MLLLATAETNDTLILHAIFRQHFCNGSNSSQKKKQVFNCESWRKLSTKENDLPLAKCNSDFYFPGDSVSARTAMLVTTPAALPGSDLG